MTFAIITDSASDVPLTLLRDQDIDVVPTIIIVNNKEYLDTEISNHDLIKFFKNGKFATTSQPSPDIFHKKYLNSLKKTKINQILGIHISSKLSGLLNVAYSSSTEIKDAEIKLIDTKNVSIGSGYFVMLACYLRDKGYSLNETTTILEKNLTRVHIEVLIDNIDYLKRSGRVSKRLFSILKIFKLKPIVTNENGLIVRKSISFGRNFGINKIANRIKKYKHVGTDPIIIVGHTDSPQDVEKLYIKLRDFHGNKIIRIEICSTLLSHTGPKVIGLLIGPNFENAIKYGSTKSVQLIK